MSNCRYEINTSRICQKCPIKILDIVYGSEYLYPTILRKNAPKDFGKEAESPYLGRMISILTCPLGVHFVLLPE